MIEPLTGPEKIALAALYWRTAGYPVDGFTVQSLIDAIESHFGASKNN